MVAARRITVSAIPQILRSAACGGGAMSVLAHDEMGIYFVVTELAVLLLLVSPD